MTASRPARLRCNHPNKHPNSKYPNHKQPNPNHPNRSSPSTRSTLANKGKLNDIPVIQINLKRKRNAWATLLSNIHDKRNPVILATEPYTNNVHLIPPVHKDLIMYYCKMGVIRPRAALLIHKNLEPKCWELKQFTTPDQVAIKITHDSKELILASSYMYITGPAPARTLPVGNIC